MKRLLSQIIAAALGLWLSSLYVPGIIIRAYPTSNFFSFPLTTQWQIILVLGFVLGLLNYFLRPLLKALALPLELITLGLFTIVIDMGLIWILDKMFDELYVPLFLPLVYTTLIIWGINIILWFFSTKHNK
ncbi:MAG: phage holin family protein [Candidatus Staskawiczbacteria bacterium]|nr:phage holin family protein [Candidatus Staskawiczbacteria bacterium]